MPKAKQESNEEMNVLQITEGRVDFCLLGKTPLILHSMARKAAQELLVPRKKTAADRAANLKHNPLEEFRASCDLAGDDTSARLLMLATAFKGAIRSVAVDIPGATKAAIGRLTYVLGDYVPIFGVPKLFMAIIRNSDPNHTPDVRTRAIVPQWAARLSITYVLPIIREQTVANLLAAAGIMRGVGDWRPEKGSGNFGQFELVSADDPRFLNIIATGGREAQDEALAHPEPYDSKSAELLTWFLDEAGRRGFKVVA